MEDYLLFVFYLFVRATSVGTKTGESSVMSISKLRNSTAIDKALGMTAVNDALKTDAMVNIADRVQVENPTLDLPAKHTLTADAVNMYLKQVSASSCSEIDSLIGDLRGLREKLVADRSRIEQDVAEFATLNQSVIQLTDVVADSVAQVKAPSLAE
jgi:hypothetical protein